MASITVEEGKDMLRTGYLSDFRISCGDIVFPVHKAIIARKSPYFKICVDGNFKETASGVIDLSDVDPFVLGLALVYIYCGRFFKSTGYGFTMYTEVTDLWPTIPSPVDVTPSENASFIIDKVSQLCLLADRLMMDDLLRVARSTLCDLGNPVSEAWVKLDNSGSDNRWVSFQVRETWVTNVLLHFANAVYEYLPDNIEVRSCLVNRSWSFCYYENDVVEVQAAQDEIEELVKREDSLGWAVAAKGFMKGSCAEFQDICMKQARSVPPTSMALNARRQRGGWDDWEPDDKPAAKMRKPKF